MNVVLQLRLKKRYLNTLVSWEEYVSDFCFGAFSLTWQSQCYVAGDFLASSVLRPLLVALAGDPFCCPSMCASALPAVSFWLRMTCCIALCRCGQVSHPSESWRPGFRSPLQAFWMWCHSTGAIQMLSFQIFGYCGGNEGNQESSRQENPTVCCICQ